MRNPLHGIIAVLMLSVISIQSFAHKNAPAFFHKQIKTDRPIRGVVTNVDGDALQGVNITVKGSAAGTVTSPDGSFSISVPENGFLVISYVGYTSQEIAVPAGDRITIVLQRADKLLEDVVVTALGIRRNTKSLTYSTQTVSAEKLTEARELNVVNSLEGKVAGLSVTSSGSGVGGEVRVVMRGNRSINGDSQPLFIVDGVPYSGSPADISPDNIASMNILKGANAAALYGSDAQNGVVIIETKKGVAGSHISLNQTFMTQTPYNLIPFQNVYGQGVSETFYKEADQAWGPKMDGRMVETWSLDPADAGKQYAFLAQPNNKKDVFQKGFNLATNVTATMGDQKTQGLFSYTFTDGKGILPNNDLKRHNVVLRLSSKLTSRLTIDTKAELIRQSLDNLTSEAASNMNPYFQIYTMPPNMRTADVRHYEFTDADGNKVQNYWNPSSADGENPYWIQNRDQNTNTHVRGLLMTSLTYAFTDALKLMVRGSYDGANDSWERMWHNGTYNVAPYGMYWTSKSDQYVLNTDFLLSYNKVVGKNWNMKAGVGGSAKKTRNSSLLSNTGLALLVPNLFTLSNTNLPVTTSNPGSNRDLHSLYAFYSLGWKNGLFLDLTGRNDWSSTLPASNRSYFYPSAGLSAVLTDLIPTFPKAISFAKLRGSYAIVGNSPDPYMLQRTATTSAGGVNGFLQLDKILPNPNLLPEKTISTEIGLEMRFLDDRLGLDLTAYKTNTKNQLFTVALPVGSGASSYFTNGGDVQNKGLELMLTTQPVRSRDFIWDLNFNFSENRNLVKKISDDRPRVIVDGNDSYFKDFVIAQGEPYGQLYGRGWKRDDQNNVIIGSDGLPEVTDGRTILLANFSPRWMGGIVSSFSYKQFSLGFVIDHREGGTMVSASNAVIDGLGLSERTLPGREGGLIFGENFFPQEHAVLENGSKNNIEINSQSFWRYVGGLNTPIAEPFVIDGTSTRLRELTFGYSLPASLVAKAHLAQVKLSLVGRNLFFIHRASPYADPDIMVGTDKTSEGFQSFGPPSSRYYGVNFKIGF